VELRVLIDECASASVVYLSFFVFSGEAVFGVWMRGNVDEWVAKSIRKASEKLHFGA